MTDGKESENIQFPKSPWHSYERCFEVKWSDVVKHQKYDAPSVQLGDIKFTVRVYPNGNGASESGYIAVYIQVQSAVEEENELAFYLCLVHQKSPDKSRWCHGIFQCSIADYTRGFQNFVKNKDMPVFEKDGKITFRVGVISLTQLQKQFFGSTKSCLVPYTKFVSFVLGERAANYTRDFERFLRNAEAYVHAYRTNNLEELDEAVEQSTLSEAKDIYEDLNLRLRECSREKTLPTLLSQCERLCIALGLDHLSAEDTELFPQLKKSIFAGAEELTEQSPKLEYKEKKLGELYTPLTLECSVYTKDILIKCDQANEDNADIPLVIWANSHKYELIAIYAQSKSVFQPYQCTVLRDEPHKWKLYNNKNICDLEECEFHVLFSNLYNYFKYKPVDVKSRISSALYRPIELLYRRTSKVELKMDSETFTKVTTLRDEAVLVSQMYTRVQILTEESLFSYDGDYSPNSIYSLTPKCVLALRTCETTRILWTSVNTKLNEERETADTCVYALYIISSQCGNLQLIPVDTNNNSETIKDACIRMNLFSFTHAHQHTDTHRNKLVLLAVKLPSFPKFRKRPFFFSRLFEETVNSLPMILYTHIPINTQIRDDGLRTLHLGILINDQQKESANKLSSFLDGVCSRLLPDRDMFMIANQLKRCTQKDEQHVLLCYQESNGGMTSNEIAAGTCMCLSRSLVRK